MIALIYNDKKSSPETLYFDIIAEGEVAGDCKLYQTPHREKEFPGGFERTACFTIDDDHRERGYAAEAFHLLVREAKLRNLSELVLIIPQSDGPQKTIAMKSGALFMEEKENDNGEMFGKYKIPL